MFQISAIIDGVRTLKNNSLKIALETQDISSYKPEELSELFKLNEKQIWVAFKETEVKEDELAVPESVPEFKNEKSPSQRLRNVLYVYWQQNKPTKDFETFRRTQMEKFINIVKEKLC